VLHALQLVAQLDPGRVVQSGEDPGHGNKLFRRVA
jgi:hypothetical protein